MVSVLFRIPNLYNMKRKKKKPWGQNSEIKAVLQLTADSMQLNISDSLIDYGCFQYKEMTYLE